MATKKETDQKKAAWAKDVEDTLDSILAFLRINHGGNLRQPVYKEELFAIFLKAYVRGYCCPLRYLYYSVSRYYKDINNKPHVVSDTIWERALNSGWIDSETPTENERMRNLQYVMDCWEEWTYALKETGYKRRLHQTIEK